MHIKRVRLCQRMGELMVLKYVQPPPQVFHLRIQWPTCYFLNRENKCPRSSASDHRIRRQSLDGYMFTIWVAFIFHLKHMSCPSQPMLNITASLSNHFDELSSKERSMVHTCRSLKSFRPQPWNLFPKMTTADVFVSWVMYIQELLAKSWAGVKL